jgi:hypothetical protein
MHVCKYADDILISHTMWVCEEVDWVDQVAFENKCGVGKVFIK